MKKRSNPEAGFALLFVYMMAAAVAIMLYMQIPSAAFEAQRDREQLLIDRGHEYSRAVQLYVRKYNKFPVDLDALEHTDNLRFLRRRFPDPMTGKTDWRLIHVGPGGVFIDSVVNKKKPEQTAQQTFITELQPIGGATTGTEGGVNLAARKRPGDTSGGNGIPGSPSFPANGLPAGATPNPNDPNAANANPANGPVMVLPDGRVVPVNLPGMQLVNGQTPAGAPGQPGQTLNGQPVLQGTPTPLPGQPGQPAQNGQTPANAVNLINTLLTTPRPQGSAGIGGAAPVDQFGRPLPTTTGGAQTTAGLGSPIGGGPTGQIIGGGIGGVASKFEQEGIKIFNERSAYNEWEFVYDVTKDPAKTPQANTAPQNGQQNLQQQNGTTPAVPPVPGMPGMQGTTPLAPVTTPPGQQQQQQ